MRYALRGARRNPAFTAAAICSLALGVGANVGLFSVLDGLLMRLLPVQHPERLVLLKDTSSDRFVYRDFEELRTRSRLLSGVAAIMYLPKTLEITDHDRSVQVAMQVVSADYFRLLGAGAARGRTPGGENGVALISDRYWRARYGGSLAAIGERFRWADWDFTIAGVAEPGFHGILLDTPADVFVPLETAIPPGSELRAHGRSVSVIARLQPGVTREQAAAEATALLRRAIRVEDGGTGVSWLRERFTRPLLILQLLVGFVLVIACSNLANLALAAGVARQREIAVRQALGARRGRLIRQLMTESALQAAAGGAVAILVGLWISTALLRFLPPNTVEALPNLEYRLDTHMLAFTAAVTAATWLIFGVLPAIRATRSAPIAGLRLSARDGGALSGWLSRGLVVCEVGLCSAVLVTSGLFLRTLGNLRTGDPAAAPERVVVANIPTPKATSNVERVAAFDEVRARLEAMPEVRAAGYVHVRPLTGRGLSANVTVEGRPARPGEDADTLTERISPGFLPAIGMPLVEGRDFTDRDDTRSPPVAIVNQAFARHFLDGGRAVGARVHLNGDVRAVEIAGLVKDTRWLSLREPPAPMIYRPFRQDSASFATLVVRTTGGPGTVAAAVARMGRETSPPLAIDDIVPFTELEDRALFTERMIARVSGAFGLLALAIACVGLYGLLSYGVMRRTREIGIRMALGATSAGVQWLVLRESAALLAAGFAIGIPAELAAGRFAGSLLFGLAAADPSTIASVLAVMATTGIAAACIPARRAVRIDPVAALRSE